MRKALSKKLGSSSRLIHRIKSRKVLSHRKPPREISYAFEPLIETPPMTTVEYDPKLLVEEIDRLKSKIVNLESFIDTLQTDVEQKELSVAKLARDKEKLTHDMLKLQRANSKLLNQLEDERNFHFKEKEIYCQEMNDFKKLKKVLSSSDLQSKLINGDQLEKVKKEMTKTLHVNYNLSIKFLKMRETKSQLKRALMKTEKEHKIIVEDLRKKIEIMSREFNEIITEKFKEHISPSNKKYLKLVNQNSSLVYENLCLQLQIDQSRDRYRKLRLQQTKSETNLLKHNDSQKKKKHPNRLRILRGSEDDNVIKLYERDEKPGVPTVTILNEKEVSVRHSHKCTRSTTSRIEFPFVNESKLTVFQVSELQSQISTTEVASVCKESRSRSAPKIVQNVSFKSGT